MTHMKQVIDSRNHAISRLFRIVTTAKDNIGYSVVATSRAGRHRIELTHWGLMTHICVGKLANIGSDNGLAPGRRQAIIWTNAGISLIGPLGTNFSEILVGVQTFSFRLRNGVHFISASMS